MKLTNLLESIEDKGIFKAVFLGGLPGSGKTTIIRRVMDGAVQPRIVNTDRTFEFLARKTGVEANSEAWELLGPRSKTLNAELLYHYLNGMLPMFIDGTSSSPPAFLRRQGILESLGYDTMLLWVDVSLETALERIQQRDRKVNPEFVKAVHSGVEEIKQFYRERFGPRFVEVSNEQGDSAVPSAAQKFFWKDINNPIGRNNVQELREAREKYLAPTVFDKQHLEQMITVWYKK